MTQSLYFTPSHSTMSCIDTDDDTFSSRFLRCPVECCGFTMNQYVVLQVTLKEKLIGTASKNLKELEDVINAQAAKGYRLHHTITTASANSTGFGGGDRIQATMVFEKL